MHNSTDASLGVLVARKHDPPLNVMFFEFFERQYDSYDSDAYQERSLCNVGRYTATTYEPDCKVDTDGCSNLCTFPVGVHNEGNVVL